MSTIYFIAAGKGSRMKSVIPKALHSINGATNLVRNIQMLKYVDRVKDYRVVINEIDENLFLKHIDKNKLIKINSGLGSGHAIMNVDFKDDDIIIWGDAVIVDSDIIRELTWTESNSSLIVPLQLNQNPYVNFKIDPQMNIKEVLFSKYHETSDEGYQDCCIFKVKESLKEHMKTVHNVLWKNKYMAPGSEFEFLYMMHYLYNINEPAMGYVTDYPNGIVSYNTQEELYKIKENML